MSNMSTKKPRNAPRWAFLRFRSRIAADSAAAEGLGLGRLGWPSRPPSRIRGRQRPVSATLPEQPTYCWTFTRPSRAGVRARLRRASVCEDDLCEKLDLVEARDRWIEDELVNACGGVRLHRRRDRLR